MVLAMDDNIDELMGSEDVAWRDILYSVLKGMDPWDVNLVELASRYSQKVDEMKLMNFRIPANVVLVCSVLLRMKADILTPRKEEYADYATSLNFIFNSDYPISALLGGQDNEPYPIAVKPARVLTRRVTATELIEAIQDALAERTKTLEKAAIRAQEKDDRITELVLEPEINILEIIESTYNRVINALANRDCVPFSEMAKTKDEILFIFMSLLHLSNSQRVVLTQERLFGEIFIKPIPS